MVRRFARFSPNAAARQAARPGRPARALAAVRAASMPPTRIGLPFGALLLAMAILLGARPAAAEVFSPEMATLDNGMQVVVVTNRMAPVVTHMVWYKVGAADEPPGVSGVAHYLEHLMFRGTETHPDGAFSEIVRRNGGVDNAFTSWDYTGYFQSIAVDRLADVMALEADRMVNLRLDPAAAATELAVVREERRQRLDNDPSARLSEQMMATLYQNHPYGRPIIGWAHEIAALDGAAVEAFYDRWYAPNNAILVVTGDVSLAEVMPLAEATYGTVPPRAVPERIRPQEPDWATPREIVLSDPRVQQPSWRRFSIAPSYTTAEDDMAYALSVLDEVLGNPSTGLLQRRLVREAGIAVNAGSFYSAGSLDESNFGFYAIPTESGDFDAIEAAVDAVLAEIAADGPDAEHLDRAKNAMRIAAIYARDSLRGPAQTIGSALTTGRTVADIEAWPERIAAVTAEDVAAAAAYLRDTGRTVTGILLPEAPTDRPS